MSDTSQDAGKSMWDFATETEDEVASARPHRKALSPDPSDIRADESDAAVEAEHDTAGVLHLESPVASAAPRQRKLGGVIAAGIAVIAVGATAFVYTQGTQTASSGSTPSAVIAKQAIISPAAYTPETVRAADPLKPTSPLFAGKSLTELAMATAPIPPVAALPPTEWRGVECSSCHTWTEANLCDQGKWYETHGDAAVKRIAHPYGGEFKHSLQAWAAQGCQ